MAGMTLIGDVPTKTEMEQAGLPPFVAQAVWHWAMTVEQAGLSHRDSTYKHLVDVIARALEDQKK
jgi:hypothetical protein